MAQKDTFGFWGEEYAARYLKRQGYEILRRNWRSAAGQIDLVARDGDVFVICEVKARHGTKKGHPSQAVTPERMQRLLAAAELWLGSYPGAVARVDVISLLANRKGVTLEHVQAANL